MRVQRRLALGARMQIEGMVEVFDLFNHAYQPRMLQLGFRTTF